MAARAVEAGHPLHQCLLAVGGMEAFAARLEVERYLDCRLEAWERHPRRLRSDTTRLLRRVMRALESKRRGGWVVSNGR